MFVQVYVLSYLQFLGVTFVFVGRTLCWMVERGGREIGSFRNLHK